MLKSKPILKATPITLDKAFNRELFIENHLKRQKEYLQVHYDKYASTLSQKKSEKTRYLLQYKEELNKFQIDYDSLRRIQIVKMNKPPNKKLLSVKFRLQETKIQIKPKKEANKDLERDKKNSSTLKIVRKTPLKPQEIQIQRRTSHDIIDEDLKQFQMEKTNEFILPKLQKSKQKLNK
jgi:hypothetical protein